MRTEAPPAPTAVYRLQLRPHLDFYAAAQWAGYLRDLGVSHLYTSPLFQASPGSPHGYDQTDPTRIDEELGGWKGFSFFTQRLQEYQLGLMVDIVPNHLAATPENPWWQDVLRRGRRSPYARFFDIDWQSPHPRLAGRIFLPVLGEAYHASLAAGALVLVAAEGRPCVAYGEQHFPLRPGSHPGRHRLDAWMAGVNAHPQRLDGVLSRQFYQLGAWQAAGDEVNYRRFFDINQLVGVRVESPRVLARTHQLIAQLVSSGQVSGVRVDHIDGLADPQSYLKALRRLLGDDCYLVVEKILEGEETLPASWPVEGTTGYDFINLVEGLMLPPTGTGPLVAAYRCITGRQEEFAQVTYQAKRQVIAELFWAEWSRLTQRLCALTARQVEGYDVSRRQLQEALAALTAAMPTYRTYLGSPVRADAGQLALALARAGATPGVHPLALELLGQVLKGEVRDQRAAGEWTRRWQQWAPAVMAKGQEDTAFYRYWPTSWLNEVGVGPDRAPLSPDEFHQRMRGRAPTTINATSTHDTKRSEDVRARLQVLAAWPDAYWAHLGRWVEHNRQHRGSYGGQVVPSAPLEVGIYQTLLGIWPLDPREREGVEERLCAYLLKAGREAKEVTSWQKPSPSYENALVGFARRLLRDGAFLETFEPFQQNIAFQGARHSLIQTVLKLTLPGVPDIYQGNETWNFALVDPDNRRRANLGVLAERLRWLGQEAQRDPGVLLRRLTTSWPDGNLKLYLTARLLNYRRRHPQLFSKGEYLPLPVTGVGSARALAFARVHQGETVVVAVLLNPAVTHPTRGVSLWEVDPKSWGEQAVDVRRLGHGAWCELFSGCPLNVDSSLNLAQLFVQLPVAVLCTTP